MHRAPGLIVPDRAGLHGSGTADLWSADGYAAHIDGDPLALFGDLAHVKFTNLVTQVGDEYYAERAAGISSPPAQITGMQLGTDATAVAKTGAGSSIVAYVAGSNVPIDDGFPTSALNASSRRIQWKASWAVGTGTANDLSEVVLINQSIAIDSGAAEAATISRALISPVLDKAATDTLAITWNHDLLGA